MSLRLPPLSVSQTYRHFYYETDVLEISPNQAGNDSRVISISLGQ